VDVIILFLSILTNGSVEGLDPVAITAFSKFIFKDLLLFSMLMFHYQ